MFLSQRNFHVLVLYPHLYINMPPRTKVKPSLSRFRAKARQLVESGTMSQMSFLESTSVSPSTLVDYSARLLLFSQVCTANGLDWHDTATLDLCIIMVLDVLFWDGMSSSDGTKLLAAIKLRFPIASSRTDLPRAHRCVNSWLKQQPPRQRVPIPWLGFAAILGFLCWKNEVAVALQLLIQFLTYLRPGVNDALTVGQLVGPTPLAGPAFQFWGLIVNPSELHNPSKTGGYDAAVVIDREIWLGEFLHILRGRRSSATRLWPTSTPRVIQLFKEACSTLGLDVLEPCRYSLRHAAASHELLNGIRPLTEIKKRGDWRSDASVRRYAKDTLILRELERMPQATVVFGRQVADHLPMIFHRSKLIQPPSLRAPSMMHK